MPIRAVIVDDEAYARRKIRDFCRAEKDVEVVGEAANGSDAVRLIRAERPDLVFLDVQMPAPDGFGVVEALDLEDPPQIVFATAYDQYALRAFDVHALDYLLKPFDQDRFREALARARRAIAAEKDRADFGARLKGLIEDARSKSPYLRRLPVPSARGVRFLKPEDVLFIEASGSYAALHTASGEHLLHERLSELERKLDPRVFVRTHRSYIINVEHIREVQPYFHGESVVVMDNERRIGVSRSFRENFRKILDGRF
jgi:two-component system LytT family response regulator